MRVLLLAAFVVAVPAFAQAACPGAVTAMTVQPGTSQHVEVIDQNCNPVNSSGITVSLGSVPAADASLAVDAAGGDGFTVNAIQPGAGFITVSYKVGTATVSANITLTIPSPVTSLGFLLQ
jgi:hypothetical protein